MTLTLEAIQSMPVAQKTQLAHNLAGKLGSGWTGLDGEDMCDAIFLRHAPTGLDFAAIPGGQLELGITEDDFVALTSLTSEYDPARIAEQRAAASPAHPVDVRPFLCSRDLLRGDLFRKLAGDPVKAGGDGRLPRAEAGALARRLGFRLPSEAELEWLGRDARGLALWVHELQRVSGDVEPEELDIYDRVRRQPSRFGLRELVYEQWAEDDWHPTYTGAPGDSRPWLDGDPSGVYRGDHTIQLAQGLEGYADALAGARRRNKNQAYVRLALAVPP